MQKYRSKKLLLTGVICLLLCLLFTVTGIVVFAQGRRSGEEVWSQTTLEAEYDVGSSLEIPARTLTVGGQTVTAKITVIYPDGTAVEKSEVLLSQSGVYTVRYDAWVEGNLYSVEETFLVSEYLYSFTSDKSSAVYDAANGLYVTLAEGDSVTFNQIIDVSTLSSTDVLMEGRVVPFEEGLSDFSRLYFTFTDVEDPGKYLTISARESTSTGDYAYLYTYFKAAGDNQTLTGVENFVTSEGEEQLRIHVEGASEYGRPVQHSFSDTYKKGTATLVGSFVLHYDADTMATYVGNGISQSVIAQLNNPAHFKSLWSGFTSGRVRLTVTGSGYGSASGRFLIKSLYGVDLSAGKLSDTQGPVITVNSKYADDMPDVAKGTQYAIPTATARDSNTGNCAVQTSVWYNYSSPNRTMVSIQDGKFTATRIGEYAIVYEAQDKFGNVTTEILFVESKETVAKPTLTLSGEAQEQISLGELILPLDYTVVSNSGDAEVKTTVKFGSEEYPLPQSGFRPEEEGTYTVVYTATDYIGQKGTVAYQVEAVKGNPVFIETPTFPQVLLNGSTYTLPNVYINDYSSGRLEQKLVYPTISDASGTHSANGNVVTPNVATDGDELTLTYSYPDATSLVVKIPVACVWQTDPADGMKKLDLSKYFFCKDGGLSYEKADRNIAVTTSSPSASWVFANALVAEGFESVLYGVEGKANFAALHVTLTDSQNQDVAVTVKLINNGKKNINVVVGEYSASVSAAFGSGDKVVLGYKNKNFTVGASSFYVEKTDDGASFAGFPSQKVYLRVAFVEAQSGASYLIESVNGHTFSNATRDTTSPKIAVLGDYGGSHKLGETLVIPPAVIGDTLDPNVACSITVKAPDGSIVTSVEGVALNEANCLVAHSIQLSQYGQYSVVIVATDTFNPRKNERKLQYKILVADDVKPQISFETEMATTATVGETLILPNYTVSDNITESDKLTVSKYVYTPSGRLVLLNGESNSIQATQAGVYEFRITVMDKAGNMTLVRKFVTVQ